MLASEETQQCLSVPAKSFGGVLLYLIRLGARGWMKDRGAVR